MFLSSCHIAKKDGLVFKAMPCEAGTALRNTQSSMGFWGMVSGWIAVLATLPMGRRLQLPAQLSIEGGTQHR